MHITHAPIFIEDRACNIPLCGHKDRSTQERGMAELRDVTSIITHKEDRIYYDLL